MEDQKRFWPIQMLCVAFDGSRFKGEILPELDRLKAAGTVRVIDLLVVRKDAEGRVMVMTATDLDFEDATAFGSYVGTLVGFGAGGAEGADRGAIAGAAELADGHFFDEDDVFRVTQTLPNGMTTALLLLEHLWMGPLLEAVERADGVELENEWFDPVRHGARRDRHAERVERSAGPRGRPRLRSCPTARAAAAAWTATSRSARTAARRSSPRRRRAAREERRVVTVLFADLAGFTARAEQLDPEDVRALLAPYHAHLRTELERFGGTVEKFIGDAVMALFGAPVAHEDDPERAVRAALAIRDWAREQGDDLSVRIAVNTGEALVTLDARPSEGESMAAGDVVNSAARLQTAAPLNGVLVGERTYRATADVFEYRGAEPVVAKGKAEPIHAWEAVAARSRFGVDVTRRPTTPLVGRSRELDLLVSTLERVREERSPQLVTLVGVPGIGKSRLVHELFGHVEQGPGLVRWRQGRSLPYGDGVTFWALAEIVKAEAGALESDSTEETEEKLRHAVGRVAADAAEAQWLERQLRPLVGLAEDGASASAGEAAAGWRRFLELLAAERPLVLRVRGPPLGGRRAARVRRRPRRTDDRRAAARARDGAPRAAPAPAGLGRRQAERAHGVALAPVGRGDGAPRGAPARPDAARGRLAGRAARAGRRQPAVRGAVRARAQRAGRPRRPPRDGAGHHRRAARRALARGEAAAPGRRRGRERLLARGRRVGLRVRALGARGAAPRRSSGRSS